MKTSERNKKNQRKEYMKKTREKAWKKNTKRIEEK